MPIEYKTPDATVYVAPVLATELVALAGLQSGELFAWNVRQALGRTKVNKAIADSINEQSEHKNFLLYHNGLTILAEKAEHLEDHLVIDGYTEDALLYTWVGWPGGVRPLSVLAWNDLLRRWPDCDRFPDRERISKDW